MIYGKVAAPKPQGGKTKRTPTSTFDGAAGSGKDTVSTRRRVDRLAAEIVIWQLTGPVHINHYL